MEELDTLDLIDSVEKPTKRRHPSFTKTCVASYDEMQFKRRFRMSKKSFWELLKKVENEMNNGNDRRMKTSIEVQLLATLRFFATGSFQEVQGDLIGLTQPTISRILKRISACIAKMSGKYIKFPKPNETAMIKAKFKEIGGFPGVIGAIDGTHIEVKVPKNLQERFRNRKNRVSINVQAVVDANMKFTNLVARWPGSVHDSRIFRNSELMNILENQNYEGHLLGDSAYPCKKYLLTPLVSPNTLAELRYQNAHVKTRNVVERTFGAWKSKFNCLHIPLRLKLQTSLTVIVACGVLWNFLIDEKDDTEFESVEEIDYASIRGTNCGDSSGFSKRNSLINSYFNATNIQ
ncbi:putative nuclease HARBI1-like protein [Dinothrombium tinctorium]|uniref:Putative nuclease HARBI1-like protein n=1 Tax=Dinothrombium tinctorium TaxID=1965070 RepID=A0A443QBU0_9ACAR|nr:putative nuclease HARBI1-like protein [Dinothrombium tinctorium]